MKQNILALLLLTACSALTAQSQRGNCAQRGVMLINYLKDSVGINAAQQIRINAIHDSTCMRIQTLVKQYNGNREMAKPEIERVRREGMEQIRTVLTEEQRKKLRARKKEESRSAGIPPGL